MKPRWLLLAVGVVCLLVLAPAAALSQEGTEITCGSAVIDGTVGTAEWEGATKLPMRGNYYYTDGNFEGIPQAHGAGLTGQLHPATNGEETEGWLYLKNDERYLYVGATMDIGDEDPGWWWTWLEVAFTDEPCAEPDLWLDDKWEADTCDDDPGEGWFVAQESHEGLDVVTVGPDFHPVSEDDSCEALEVPAQGVIAKAGQHTAHYEMRIDLEGSELNCAGPGDCFRFYAEQWEWFCPLGAPCPEADWTEGWVEWPEFVYDPAWQAPDDLGTICLNPCEVQEEFVPEPGTMLLLGSGLVGLAGYAGLRWRERS